MTKSVCHESFFDYYRCRDVANSYDEYRLSSFRKRMLRAQEIAAITDAVPEGDAGNILEMGCGTGYLSQYLVSRGNLTALDPSKEMIAVAEERLAGVDGVTFKNEGFFDNGLPFDSFDCALTLRVLMHFDRSSALRSLRELASFVRHGGTVVFDLPARDFLKAPVAAWRSRHESMVPNHTYRRRDILRLVDEVDTLKFVRLDAVDHLALLVGLHVLGNLFKSDMLAWVVLGLEQRIRWLPIGNTHWVVTCKRV